MRPKLQDSLSNRIPVWARALAFGCVCVCVCVCVPFTTAFLLLWKVLAQIKQHVRECNGISHGAGCSSSVSPGVGNSGSSDGNPQAKLLDAVRVQD